MKSKIFTVLFLTIFGIASAQDLSLKDLTVDHKVNPIGTGSKQPRFSWKISGKRNNIMQTAYFLRVATDERFSSSKMIWQSGKVESEESILQSYK